MYSIVTNPNKTKIINHTKFTTLYIMDHIIYNGIFIEFYHVFHITQFHFAFVGDITKIWRFVEQRHRFIGFMTPLCVCRVRGLLSASALPGVSGLWFKRSQVRCSVASRNTCTFVFGNYLWQNTATKYCRRISFHKRTRTTFSRVTI